MDDHGVAESLIALPTLMMAMAVKLAIQTAAASRHDPEPVRDGDQAGGRHDRLLGGVDPVGATWYGKFSRIDTRWPAVKPVTPGPAASSTPAASYPIRAG